MKTVKITFHCDYCKREIDPDSDVVKAVQPGKIGYQDQFHPDPEEKIQHYHDTCLERILAMTYQAEEELKKLKEEKKNTEDNPNPKDSNKKDLGKLRSLKEAGWSVDKIADEFRVSKATIYNWLKEIGGGRAK